MIDAESEVIKYNSDCLNYYLQLGTKIVTLYCLVSAFCVGLIVKGNITNDGRYIIYTLMIVITSCGILMFHTLSSTFNNINDQYENILSNNGFTNIRGHAGMAVTLSKRVLFSGYTALIIWVVIFIGDLFDKLEFAATVVGKSLNSTILN